jgi:predicted anti-sigma-YlaC factor YlaD
MTEHLGELLSAHLDGELTSTEVGMVTHHLSECSECQNELTGLHGARAALRGLPTFEAPRFGLPEVTATVIPLHRVRKAVAVAAVAFVSFVSVATYQASQPTEVSFSDLTDTQLELNQEAPTLIPQIPEDSE